MNRVLQSTTEQNPISFERAIEQVRGVLKQLTVCDGRGSPVYTEADLLFNLQKDYGAQVDLIRRGIQQGRQTESIGDNMAVPSLLSVSRALVEVLGPEFPQDSKGLEMVQRELLAVWLKSARSFIGEEDSLRSEQKREVDYWAGTPARLPASPDDTSW